MDPLPFEDRFGPEDVARESTPAPVEEHHVGGRAATERERRDET